MRYIYGGWISDIKYGDNSRAVKMYRCADMRFDTYS